MRVVTNCDGSWIQINSRLSSVRRSPCPSFCVGWCTAVSHLPCVSLITSPFSIIRSSTTDMAWKPNRHSEKKIRPADHEWRNKGIYIFWKQGLGTQELKCRYDCVSILSRDTQWRKVIDSGRDQRLEQQEECVGHFACTQGHLYCWRGSITRAVAVV